MSFDFLLSPWEQWHLVDNLWKCCTRHVVVRKHGLDNFAIKRWDSSLIISQYHYGRQSLPPDQAQAPLPLKPTGSVSACWRHVADDTAVTRVILQRGKVRRVVDGVVGRKGDESGESGSDGPRGGGVPGREGDGADYSQFQPGQSLSDWGKRGSAPWSDRLLQLQQCSGSHQVAWRSCGSSCVLEGAAKWLTHRPICSVLLCSGRPGSFQPRTSGWRPRVAGAQPETEAEVQNRPPRMDGCRSDNNN